MKIPFGKTSAQIKKSTMEFSAGDMGHIDGYVAQGPIGTTVYAVFIRHSDGKIGTAPIERIEALIEEEMIR